MELTPALSDLMLRCLRAVRQLTVAIVNEISKTNRSMELPPLTEEEALVHNWSALMSSQLMGQWNSLGRKTKQLLRDLALLRKTAHYLLRYDCVSFYRYLNTIRVENIGEHSTWMFHEAADTLFASAKARVVDAAGDPVLEASPKWKALLDILAEIRAAVADGSDADGARSVLIVCKDERTMAQVAGVLSEGSQAWLAHHWALVGASTAVTLRPRSRSVPSFSRGSSAPSRGWGQKSGSKSKQKKKPSESGPRKRSASAASGGTRRSPPASTARIKKQAVSSDAAPAPVPVAPAPAPAELSGAQPPPAGAAAETYAPPPSTLSSHAGSGGTDSEPLVNALSAAAMPLAMDVSSHVDNEHIEINPAAGNSGRSKAALLRSAVALLPSLPAPPTQSAAARRRDFDRSFGPISSSQVVVHSLDGALPSASLLHSLKPRFVVMYDPDLAFLRCLECYNVEEGSRPFRLYTVSYSEDNEERVEVESENVAFEELIQHKAAMIVEDERGSVSRGDPLSSTGAAQSSSR